MIFRLFFILLFFTFSCKQNNELDKILSTSTDLKAFLTNKDSLEIAIIYTQIDRDSSGKPTFKTFTFNYDSLRYFYPASTVKFPIALLTLEKLNALDIPGLSISTPMLTDSAFSGQSMVRYDSTSRDNLPSIDNYIRKIFMVSDNDAFNRLYEFLGQDYINNSLHDKGYMGTSIVHRLSIPLSMEENRATNPVLFVHNDSVIHSQPLVISQNMYDRTTVLKGKGFIRNGELVPEPMDFTHKNTFPLHEQQKMLRDVIFPELAGTVGFDLTQQDYQYIYKWMSSLPGEYDYPDYSDLPDNYVKFLMFAEGKKDLPKKIKIFNKIGQAYGYVTDNAFIIDIENKVEFFLSAVIHANKNKIYNDGIYEYDSIAFPFMEKLGQAIYNHELNRDREFLPDLTKFYSF